MDGRTYGRTDGQTFFPSNIIRSTFRSRPKKICKNAKVGWLVLSGTVSTKRLYRAMRKLKYVKDINFR